MVGWEDFFRGKFLGFGGVGKLLCKSFGLVEKLLHRSFFGVGKLLQRSLGWENFYREGVLVGWENYYEGVLVW